MGLCCSSKSSRSNTRQTQGNTQLQDVQLTKMSQHDDPIGYHLMQDAAEHKGMVVCEPFDADLTSILNANSFIMKHKEAVSEFHQNWDLMDVLHHYRPVQGFKIRMSKESSVNFDSFVMSGGKSTGSGAAESALANKLKSFISLQLFNIMRVNLESEEFYDEIADAIANAVVNCAFDNDDELAGCSPTQEIKNFFFDDRTGRKWIMVSESVTIDNLLKNIGAVIYVSGVVCFDTKKAGLIGKGEVHMNMDLRIRALVYNAFFLDQQKLKTLSYYIKRHTKQPPTLVFRTHDEYLKEAFKALDDDDSEEKANLEQISLKMKSSTGEPAVRA